MKQKQKGFRQYLIRLGIFFGIFLLSSFFHSPVMNYFYGWEFSFLDMWPFYLVWVFFAFFSFYCRKQINDNGLYRIKPKESLLFGLLGLGFLALPVGYVVHVLEMDFSNIYFIIFYIAQLCMFLAVFNLRFLKKFEDEFLLLLLMVVGYLLINLVVGSWWQYFSGTIMHALSILIPFFTGGSVMDLNQFNVTLGEFSVNIGPSCSGIYSLVAFSLLFGVALYFLSRSRDINKVRALMTYLFGLILVFSLNILRIFMIILVGGFVSHDLAINLFHEYFGAIFLLMVFALYLKFVLPRLAN